MTQLTPSQSQAVLAVTTVVQPWMSYGLEDPGIQDFVDIYSDASLKVRCFDIDVDDGLSAEHVVSDIAELSSYLALPLRSSMKVRIMVVDELSSQGLQMIGSFYNMHLDFWSWVTSEDAADGYWLHGHNEGKVLCFDLPGVEFYQGPRKSTKGLVRDGRLKQLSSIHRFYGDDSSSSGILNLFVNRRVSVYLLKHHGIPVFIYIRESCPSISSVPLMSDTSDPSSEKSFYDSLEVLHRTDRPALMELAEDPFGLVIMVEHHLMMSWHHLVTKLQHDLESIDDTLNDNPALQCVPTYLDRDIVQMLERFALQMEAHEGLSRHIRQRTPEKNCLCPTQSFIELTVVNFVSLERNAQILERRLRRLISRAALISTAVHNRIANQQARLAIRQAEISTEMARLQRVDNQVALEQGRSVARLTMIATIYVPLSFAASVLSINPSTPTWVFFVVAVPCTTLTMAIMFILSCLAGRHAASRTSNQLPMWLGGSPSLSLTADMDTREKSSTSDERFSLRGL